MTKLAILPITALFVFSFCTGSVLGYNSYIKEKEDEEILLKQEATTAIEETFHEDVLNSIPTEYVVPDEIQEEVSATEPQISETEPIKAANVYETVPLIYQNDYADVRYGTDTIATQGCNMTCLAMVASYLTGHEYYPDDLVRYFTDFNGGHIDRLEYGSDYLQLPWEKAENIHATMQALREGKVAIALMDQRSIFTSGIHFIVLTGVTEDGKITVNDPNLNNYSVWNCKEGLATGFTEKELVLGYTGAWIYDKDAMPENPFVYEESEYESSESRYGDLSLTPEEETLLAKMVWLESQGEPFEGQQAVAEVILNRLASSNFPSTMQGVIYALDQFSPVDKMDTAEPTAMQYAAIERALYGPYILPMEAVFYGRSAENDNVWGSIGGHTFCLAYDYIDAGG